jgi:hypothetical protein
MTLETIVNQGALIGYTDPSSARVPVAYVELWQSALFWCSTDNGPCGGPHVLAFTRMEERINQVNFCAGE